MLIILHRNSIYSTAEQLYEKKMFRKKPKKLQIGKTMIT